MNKKIIKPWGYEELLERNKNYMFKKLYMKKGHRCSLQYHEKKIETILIIEGSLRISYGSSEKKLKSKIYKKGDFITLKPNIIHRMEGVTNCLYLEASSPEIHDVVRLVDDYNRV